MPDLTTLAKVVTGGLPGGAICGRARHYGARWTQGKPRDGLAPPVSHKGTFNAAPLVAAGAIAAMELLSTGDDVQRECRRHGRAVCATDVNACFAERGRMAAVAYGDSSTCHLYFGGTVGGGAERGRNPDREPARIGQRACAGGLLASAALISCRSPLV